MTTSSERDDVLVLVCRHNAIAAVEATELPQAVFSEDQARRMERLCDECDNGSAHVFPCPGWLRCCGMMCGSHVSNGDFNVTPLRSSLGSECSLRWNNVSCSILIQALLTGIVLLLVPVEGHFTE